MIQGIIIIILIIALPRIMVLLSSRYKAFDLLGPVFLCYAAGILLSFLFSDTSMASTLSEVCVPIAIPLILFSANLGALRKLAKPALISFGLIIAAVSVVTTLSTLLFRGIIPNAGKINSMLVGLYTGGTPNLMAIGLALGIDQDTILLANTADLLAGGIYFAFILSFIPRLLRRILPAFSADDSICDNALEKSMTSDYTTSKLPFSFRTILKNVPAFLLALICVGISLGASWLITGNATNITVVMLGVTTLGVAFSFVPKVRNLSGSYNAGQYFIYMFSVAMGLSFDLSVLTPASLLLLCMLLFVQFGSVILHIILAKIFKIDADTTLITSTAGIYGPAFIPSVANALKNKDIVLTGLICGILGYALGNYLGLGMNLVFSLI